MTARRALTIGDVVTVKTLVPALGRTEQLRGRVERQIGEHVLVQLDPNPYSLEGAYGDAHTVRAVAAPALCIGCGRPVRVRPVPDQNDRPFYRLTDNGRLCTACQTHPLTGVSTVRAHPREGTRGVRQHSRERPSNLAAYGGSV